MDPFIFDYLDDDVAVYFEYEPDVDEPHGYGRVFLLDSRILIDLQLWRELSTRLKHLQISRSAFIGSVPAVVLRCDRCLQTPYEDLDYHEFLQLLMSGDMRLPVPSSSAVNPGFLTFHRINGRLYWFGDAREAEQVQLALPSIRLCEEGSEGEVFDPSILKWL